MARSRPRYTPPPNYPSPAPIPETYNDRMQGIRFEDAPLNPYTYGTGFGQGGYVNLDELYDRSISPPGAYGQGGGSLPEYGANTVAAGLGGAAVDGLTNFGTAESGSVGICIGADALFIHHDKLVAVPRKHWAIAWAAESVHG